MAQPDTPHLDTLHLDVLHADTLPTDAVPPTLPALVALALRPLPLAPLQPALALMLRRIGQSHPGLHGRLGEHASKRFGIDPTDLPFGFVLEPRPQRPSVQAVRTLPKRLDARISGPLSALIGMAEGSLDGDALFFSRMLVVEGDVEAVLALRNAIDDARLDLGALLFGGLGPLGGLLAEMLRRYRQPAAEQPVARPPTGARPWN
ncbi:SCP2 sterol-binding domain-containing protein [Bosea sp. 124]|uniref:ubiquinone anaerobic biosynthesis accessory factor UbiT n=1 Tax=Bosea sp. 124 TaxID=2135642 RepID=UPI000D3ADA1F|nr:SCP2 sterol-binding domain-containing protein [Bosea sp. 124]PTM42100.1 putative lipid carrier protein YhbT [Bosea sp. 124]